MSDLYELQVLADGYATDADGNLLDPDGNPVETTDDEPEGDEQ